MPIHDWTRVSAGTFHDLHVAWIAELRRALNGGLLPPGYYALAEQVANQVIPDVLTLQDRDAENGTTNDDDAGGGQGGRNSSGVAVAEAPPRVALSDKIIEPSMLAAKRRVLVIRHTTGDRIVALIEIVSPGNKEKRTAIEPFVDKALAALRMGFHLLVIDLFPPGKLDPTGIHGAIWGELGGEYKQPPGKPLTLAAYTAGAVISCYVEPTSVGSDLTPMPLFLDADHYINVPLEATYMAAYEGVPQRWKRVIEGT